MVKYNAVLALIISYKVFLHISNDQRSPYHVCYTICKKCNSRAYFISLVNSYNSISSKNRPMTTGKRHEWSDMEWNDKDRTVSVKLCPREKTLPPVQGARTKG